MDIGDIKVTPEQLRKVAGTIRSTITNATVTQERLKRDIDMISSNWLGSTYMKFNTDFRDSSFKMAQFIIILEPLEKFLLDSANKFEQVDNMDVAIALASSILTGKPFKGDYEVLKGDFKFAEGDHTGFKAEGSLIEGEYEISQGNKLAFKGGSGSLEVSIPKDEKILIGDVAGGGLVGIKAGGSFFESSIQKEMSNDYVGQATVTQKYGDVSGVAGIDEYTLKLGAEVTVNKYELLLEKIDVPNIIPFFEDHDLTVRLEYGFGTAGAKIHLGQEMGAYFGKSHGGGFFAKFEKKDEE
ncbi:WXG100 family type VII secretion target [Bacillus cereus]|uniref:WXG100 family type VII secretion target n=1 Tax=Bacillus cereus TaxID=1396 RepID=UPI000995AF0B|nr:WXG100 family type VII secretion target [Bacillus cereus]